MHETQLEHRLRPCRRAFFLKAQSGAQMSHHRASAAHLHNRSHEDDQILKGHACSVALHRLVEALGGILMQALYMQDLLQQRCVLQASALRFIGGPFAEPSVQGEDRGRLVFSRRFDD